MAPLARARHGAEVLELLAAVARRAVRRLHGRSRRPQPRRSSRRARPRARTRPRSVGAGARRATRWRRSAIASSWSTPTIASWTACSTSAGSTRVAGIAGGSRRLVDAVRRRRPWIQLPPRRTARHANGPDRGPSVADLLRDVDEHELADVIFQFGEERHSRRVARAIVGARRESPIDTTGAAGRDRPARGSAQGPPAHRPGDADLPGAAHLGEPRARRARRVPRGARRGACWRTRGWRSSRSTRSRTAS